MAGGDDGKMRCKENLNKPPLILLKATERSRLTVLWPASNASDGVVFLRTIDDGEDIMGKILACQNLDLVSFGKGFRAHVVLLREIAVLQRDGTDDGPIQELRVALDDILLQHLIFEDAGHKHTREQVARVNEVVA